MNIAGNVYGKLTILEDARERNHKNTFMVTTQCECGRIKKLPKAPFIAGSNPEKCFSCHKKMVKFFPACVKSFKNY